MANPYADMAGTWYLTAEYQTEGEADLDAPDYLHDGNGEWMRASGVELASLATPVHGLTLVISDEGTFSETGQSSATLFDADGVETGGEGFAGLLEIVATGLSVFTGDRITEPVPSIADPSLLRLSDGTVDIAEMFDIVDERLIRTQNVATDGIYLVRSVLVYQRTAPTVQAALTAQGANAAKRAQALHDAETALVTALVDSARGTWKEIVAYVNADGSQLMTVTFMVSLQQSGEHRLDQDFDPEPPLDSLWKDHRAAATSQTGEEWGTAVVVITPPASPAWQIDYGVSPVMRGKPDATYNRYQKYLPLFLEENGLTR